MSLASMKRTQNLWVKRCIRMETVVNNNNNIKAKAIYLSILYAIYSWHK